MLPGLPLAAVCVVSVGYFPAFIACLKAVVFRAGRHCLPAFPFAVSVAAGVDMVYLVAVQKRL